MSLHTGSIYPSCGVTFIESTADVLIAGILYSFRFVFGLTLYFAYEVGLSLFPSISPEPVLSTFVPSPNLNSTSSASVGTLSFLSMLVT